MYMYIFHAMSNISHLLIADTVIGGSLHAMQSNKNNTVYIIVISK